MWLIRAALRRPITILVGVIAVALTAVFAVSRMRADIFPDLDLPVIYVAQPYGGMSPAQMEGYIMYYYDIRTTSSTSTVSRASSRNRFIEHQPAEADVSRRGPTWPKRSRRRSATSIARGPSCRRARSGRSSCAANVPVGYLVFSSESRSLGEIQDLALNRVRPQFAATLPGLTSPPPFGGSQRTIVIRVDPDRLRSALTSPKR